LIKHVLIVGLGFMGGSLAKSIKKYTGIKITALDINEEYLNRALEEGIISKGIKQVDCNIDADVVFICTPVGKIIDCIYEIIPYLKKGCIITDIGSTKKLIMEKIEKILPDDMYFIGGHPMAGTEKSGFTASVSNLFKDTSYFIMPMKNVPNDIVKLFVNEIIIKIGAKPVIIDYNLHDRFAAIISHIPHIVSAALSNFACSEGPDAVQYAAGGFKDTTRIAMSQTEMWRDIVISNKETIKELLLKYSEILGEFISYLDKEDIKSIEKFFDDARRYRGSIE
jgi:prephenate dehydrogenase